MTAYEQYEQHMAEINDLCCILNLLTWDARTQMPQGGTETRAFQLGTVSDIAQSMFVSDKTRRLLEEAEKELAAVNEHSSSYRARSVVHTRQAYEISRKIPGDVVAEMARLRPIAQSVWTEARQNNDFASFAPYLEKMVEMSRKIAEAIDYSDHPYDALLLRYEPGMTSAKLKEVFAELKAGSLPIVERAAKQEPPRADFLEREFPIEKQKEFALKIAQKFGYDLQRGRLDKTVHPFEISFTRNDVRISTRYDENFLPMALFGILHEAGHGIYEQNIAPELTRTSLTTDLLDLYAVGGVSYGTHESQSRLWENLIGRSRTFWQVHFKDLQAAFPGKLDDVDVETFYKAINQVKPSYIRVEADEVTYNFHIMLRVEIEMGLVDGSIKVKDLPEIWNAKMEEYLGVTPPNDRLGVLQDMHWSGGQIGTFANYTLGNLMGAQFLNAARQQVPEMDDSLKKGEYEPLLKWLTENIYQHGRAFTPTELLRRSTGQDLSAQPFIDYLNDKYGDLYP